MNKYKDKVDEYTDKLVMDFVKEKGLQDYVVIFSGRFQPFSVHHLKVYNHLVENFGKDNVYIATSNKIDLIKSPLSFEEKKKIIEKHGINNNNIYQVENPYVANEILKDFNDRTTAVIYVISDKDSDRLKNSNYYKEYDGTVRQPFRENAYVYRVPENKVENTNLSGTTVRKVLGDSNILEKEKKKMFEKFLGFYDEDIFNMLVNKFSSINEVLNNFLQYYDFNIFNIFNTDENLQLNELSRSNILHPDDGPAIFIGNYNSYKKHADDLAFRVGYDVIDYMTGGYFSSVENEYRDANSLSYFPVGIETDKITSDTFKKWKNHVEKMALPVGYSFFDFLDYMNNLKINEEEESNLVIRARDELKRAGLYDKDSDYNGMLAHAVLDLLKKFSSQQHSGMSAVMTAELFRKLVNWETLTPLTSNPEEWEKVTGDGDGQKDMWQNKRNPKYFSFDRGKTYWNVDESIFYDVYKNILEENAIIYSTNKLHINEGGLAGHINHPFEDLSLTFFDIKNLIHLGLSGQLSYELDTTEKIDGQNLYITYVNREIKAARNKKEMKNPLSKDEIKEKFKDRPELADAFYFAMQDMENFISSFSYETIGELFDNGVSFLNIEIYYPESKNVIDYDKARLVFHGFSSPFSENDDTYVDEKNKYLLRIRDMITNVNSNIRTYFEITPPVFVNINQSNDFSNKKDYFISKLQELMDNYNISYENKLEDYVYKRFEYEVDNNINNYNLTIDSEVKNGIIKWLINSNYKPMTINEIERKVDSEPFIKWLRGVDRDKKFREFIKPLEILILELGVEIMKNVNGFLNTDNDAEIRKLKNDITKTISIIKNSNNVDDINLLTKNLEKLNNLGGLDSIVPSEGIVFKYRGKLYKITGSFAPINKILGILKYKNN